MSVTNVFSPLSESASGTPIIVTEELTKLTVPLTNPGVLIHTSTTEVDSLWIWVSIDNAVSYLDTVYIRILKGNNTDGYLEDSLVRVKPGEKNLIESGVIITSNTQYRMYIDSELSTVIPNVAVTGYVHRRIY